MFKIGRTRIQRFSRLFSRISTFESEHLVELVKVIAFVGWLLIIGGLVGELKSESKIAELSASIQECSDARVAKATLDAGDAATSAKTAHDEAEKAIASAKSAGGLATSAKSNARSALRETALVKSENEELANRMREQNAQLNAVTPRLVVLRRVKEDVVEMISRFQGQLIDVKICGMEAPSFRGLPTTDDGLEKVNVRDVLVDILILKAKWKWTSSGKGRPVYWTRCSMAWQQSRGIFVFVNASAVPDTMKAATVLSNELSSVLPRRSAKS